MKATEMTMMGSTGTSVVLGILAAVLVLATLTGRKIPFISSDRAVLIVLVVLGMAMCTRGIGYVGATGAWAHPLAILGYLLGAAILVVAGALLLGKPLPWVADTHQAVLVVAVLGAAKMIFSALHRFLF